LEVGRSYLGIWTRGKWNRPTSNQTWVHDPKNRGKKGVAGRVEARRMEWLEWKRENHQGSWGSPAREELGFRSPGSRHYLKLMLIYSKLMGSWSSMSACLKHSWHSLINLRSHISRAYHDGWYDIWLLRMNYYVLRWLWLCTCAICYVWDKLHTRVIYFLSNYIVSCLFLALF
jgi:hypothetical protein